MKFFILISAVTLVSGQQWGTSVSQCVSNRGPLPIVTEIPGCSTPPCILNTGGNIDIDILFRVPHNVNSLRTRAVAFVSIIPISFELGLAGDTCSNLLSGRCPAGQGALLLHRLSMFLDEFLPPVILPIEIIIEDEENVSVACFRVNINISHPTTKLIASKNTQV